MEPLRHCIAQRIQSCDRYHIVDSLPLEVCRFSCARGAKVCQDAPEVAPDYGYCAAQKMTCFGYKIHTVCTVQGVLQTLDTAQASVHDIHYLDDIKSQFHDCVLMGDKGYLSQQGQQDLFDLKRLPSDWKPLSG